VLYRNIFDFMSCVW